MNNPIHKLANMSEKNSRRIVGLMSGTSLDGLDVAVCKITGFGKSTSIEVEHFETITYPEYWNERLSLLSSKKQIDALNLCLTNNHLAIWHAEQINKIVSRQIIPKQFKPDAVADLVELLIDSRSDSLSGQVLHVGGA
jgi:anhydro-N-acetylmuramic acid kinase